MFNSCIKTAVFNTQDFKVIEKSTNEFLQKIVGWELASVSHQAIQGGIVMILDFNRSKSQTQATPHEDVMRESLM